MKKLTEEAIQAINRLSELLTRDCGGTEWELSMHNEDIFLSGGWKDDDIDIDTKLPLKP
jgi:hypothetical protein